MLLRDFVGNELAIGDEIVYCRSRRHGIDMTKTTVIGFTKHMVKIDLPTWDGKSYSLAAPGNCIVYRVKE